MLGMWATNQTPGGLAQVEKINQTYTDTPRKIQKISVIHLCALLRILACFGVLKGTPQAKPQIVGPPRVSHPFQRLSGVGGFLLKGAEPTQALLTSCAFTCTRDFCETPK